MSRQKHVVVVGSGVAGLTCALGLIDKGHKVTIVTKSRTSDSATWYAQGGIASAMFPDDTVAGHIEDTLVAGAGLCDRDAVSVLVNNGADAVRKLIARGAHFDTLADGSYARTREGGHHNNRIIHAGGDATGEEIERSLVKAASNETFSLLNVIDFHMVTALLTDKGSCVGIECIDASGMVTVIESDDVVLATGGAGQLFHVTTNPVLATADGVALALNTGVACADLEFMQFHPTALHVDNMPRPLLSEALRGEGAILRDENGVAFMDGVHPLKDLAPRDIVSREIASVISSHDIEHVFLDATSIDNFSQRFPTIFASCEQVGIDPASEYLPVSPAAHYFCGGVVTDLNGATSLPHLWAAGEVACNGVHGANRLASNSLLDGLVFGDLVAEGIDQGIEVSFDSGMMDYIGRDAAEASVRNYSSRVSIAAASVPGLRTAVQKTMTRHVGVVRNEKGIKIAQDFLGEVSSQITHDNNAYADFSAVELGHIVCVAHAVIASAQSRLETRGCHTRDDFPMVNDEDERAHYIYHRSDDGPLYISIPEDEL